MKRIALALALLAACGKKPEAGPSGGGAPKQEEKTVEAKRDPLAYKMHQLPAGSVAVFDGWNAQQTGSQGSWSTYVTAPAGKENEFQLFLTVGTPDAQEMAQLFQLGPALVRQAFPMLRPAGATTPTKFGGDDAMTERYEGSDPQGRKLVAAAVYIKKKDVGVGVLGVGTESAFATYGRAVDIVAQSITIKDAQFDPRLVGTWAYEKYTSSGSGERTFSSSTSNYITIYPNGAFTENSHTYASNRDPVGDGTVMAEGGNRGRVLLRGNMLTFHYDSGKAATSTLKLEGNGAISLNGTVYFKQ